MSRTIDSHWTIFLATIPCYYFFFVPYSYYALVSINWTNIKRFVHSVTLGTGILAEVHLKECNMSEYGLAIGMIVSICSGISFLWSIFLSLFQIIFIRGPLLVPDPEVVKSEMYQIPTMLCVVVLWHYIVSHGIYVVCVLLILSRCEVDIGFNIIIRIFLISLYFNFQFVMLAQCRGYSRM